MLAVKYLKMRQCCVPVSRGAPFTLQVTGSWLAMGAWWLVPPLSGTSAVHTEVPVLLAMLSPGAQSAQPSQNSLQGAESKNWEIDEEKRGCRFGYC